MGEGDHPMTYIPFTKGQGQGSPSWLKLGVGSGGGPSPGTGGTLYFPLQFSHSPFQNSRIPSPQSQSLDKYYHW